MDELLKIIFIFFALVGFLFSFWKRLREDYSSEQIFSTSFLSLIGIILGVISANFLLANFWFYLGLLGGVIGLFIGVLKYKLRIFETLEAGILGGLVLIFFVFLYNFISQRSFSSGFFLLVSLSAIVLFDFLNKNYKNFSWYASGRVGFSGLTVAGLFFLTRSLVAYKFPYVLSFVGNYEVYLSGIIAFVMFLLLFNLSRRLL